MGRNKHIKKEIAGYERTIWRHRLKIENELKKDFPDHQLLEKWRKDIKRAEARIEVLISRLERRRKNAQRKKSIDLA